VTPLELVLSKLPGHRKNGAGYLALCPVHEDHNPSLSITSRDGRVLMHCFAGCATEAIVSALGLSMSDLFEQRTERGAGGVSQPVKTVTPLHSPIGLTLAGLAEAKKLSPDFLRGLGLSDLYYNGAPAVRIPYVDAGGNVTAVRFRLSLGKEGPRFRWRKGDHPALYGLNRLAELRRAGWVLLVEGESDCWTLWHYRLPALGIPGKSTWRHDWSTYLDGLTAYLWQEPDAANLPARIATDVPSLRVLRAPPGVKDVSEAHIRGDDIRALIERLKAEAIPVEVIQRAQAEAHLTGLVQQAAPVLSAADPLTLIEAAIRRLGYGGDIRPALITYLAVTSRLLAMRPGAMPVHLLLIGPASAGKSWTVQLVTRLLPPDACHSIDAGSPRVLVYDDCDLRHRVLVFGESDSLPSGEDNPAASAVRNLLQDNFLHYQVVVRGPATGDFVVRYIQKDGPTVLITTSVRRLGEQLMTRLFALEVADDPGQVGAALRTQADLELSCPGEPDLALVAMQAYLQARAPWDVVVPFARELAEAISKSATAPRILRDYVRLLALVKSVTVLRHCQRRTDGQGRLVAEIEDYATVHGLVTQMYTDNASGATEGVRAAVEAVARLIAGKNPGEKVTITTVGAALGISKMAASRRVKVALKAGWLFNAETRKNHPFDLTIGEPLPERTGLPAPQVLVGCNAVTPLTAGNIPPSYPDESQDNGDLDDWEAFYDTTTDQPEPTLTQPELVTSPAVVVAPGQCCEFGCNNPVAPGATYFCEQHRPSAGIPF
jgi:hypothetical protein